MSRSKNGDAAYRLARDRAAWPKPLPPRENPNPAIPSAVLEQLSREQLPASKEAYQQRLAELLAAEVKHG
jgi:hypothetical protein